MVKLLEDRIKKDGQVIGTDVLKVDNFLNHQVDPDLMADLGKEVYRRFSNEPITKILTVESSGIAPWRLPPRCRSTSRWCLPASVGVSDVERSPVHSNGLLVYQKDFQ